MALRYVDSAVASSGNGQSWATAWKAFSNITGLSAGDTVYFSGGATSKNYSVNDWAPAGGTTANRITYAVGQDAGHNGIVNITSTNFLNGSRSGIKIDGNVGGAAHWRVTPSGYFWESGGGTGVTLRYIDVPNVSGFLHNGGGSTWEIDHCSIVQDRDYANMHDFIFYGAGGASASDLMLVHDNYIQFPMLTTDHSYGDDMWIWPENINFYNNTVRGVRRATYGSGSVQHSDLFQTDRASNIYVHHNTFIDPGESGFYEDSNSGGGTVSNIWIYNNLYLRTFAANGGAQRTIDFNPENAAAGLIDYVDIVIANNTIIGGNSSFGIRVSGQRSSTRVYVVNNIGQPGGADVTADAGVTVSNNYNGSGVSFVSYSQYGGTSNNLHLAATDTAAKGKGRTMSTYFSNDFESNTRSVPWDIGAYGYNLTASPPVGTPVLSVR